VGLSHAGSEPADLRHAAQAGSRFGRGPCLLEPLQVKREDAEMLSSLFEQPQSDELAGGIEEPRVETSRGAALIAVTRWRGGHFEAGSDPVRMDAVHRWNGLERPTVKGEVAIELRRSPGASPRRCVAGERGAAGAVGEPWRDFDLGLEGEQATILDDFEQ